MYLNHSVLQIYSEYPLRATQYWGYHSKRQKSQGGKGLGMKEERRMRNMMSAGGTDYSAHCSVMA